jgi:hypothetical protein
VGEGGRALLRRSSTTLEGKPGISQIAVAYTIAAPLTGSRIRSFPAEHWKHLRTTNIIESSFATIRH